MMYRIKISTVAFASFLCMFFGCMKGEINDDPQQSVPIILGVDGLDAPNTKSSGPVDKWEFTPVSVAYLFEPNTVFDKSMTITVKYNETAEHVNTGLEYPDDDSEVSFIGYHPVVKPNTVGTVSYDLSKGNVDVMMSNRVSGSKFNRIYDEIGNNRKLIFEHLLTRVTFKLECAVGHSYPEPVYGLRATAASSTLLNTALTIDLATQDLTFKVAGGVFSGNLDGYVIPPFGGTPVVVDMMLQPGVPLKFTVSSLTGEKDITITSDTNSFWDKLITKGGDRGVQYTVVLRFSGQLVLAQNITITPWITGKQNLGIDTNNGSYTWW